MTGLIIFIVCTLLLALVIFGKLPRKPKATILPPGYKELLYGHVAFYRALPDAGKTRFEEKVKDFLSYVRIHGVQTTVSDLDKLLVACSAVIPIFGFDNWRYGNLRDVLLYEGAFDRETFSQSSGQVDTLGMVGTGAMQQMMILSKRALRMGFIYYADKMNTGIHEFVHLLDKADGALDGVPEQLLQHPYTIPWIKLMNDSIDAIIAGNSDIDAYGATSKAEFFAVAAEYFFERPDLLQQHHPGLYQLLQQVFNQQPVTIPQPGSLPFHESQTR